MKKGIVAVKYEAMDMKKIIYTGIAILTVALNIAAIFVNGFSDFYTENVFPIWVNSLGRLTSLFPFSIGEIMIVAGVMWLVVLAIFTVISAAEVVFYVCKNNSIRGFFKSGIGKGYSGYLIWTSKLLVIIGIIMTLNCFINYRTTPLGETKDKREYTISELSEFRDFVVTKCNELSLEVERDENGQIIYPYVDYSPEPNSDDTTYKTQINEAMAAEAKKSMNNIGDSYSRLSGFYVTPKPLFFSGFVSQQHMQGYYFPFSMEANYNNEMHMMNKPFTMCHELAHTRSFILEDEANFLAYIACRESNDLIFRYSGYLGILNYVNNTFYKNVSEDEYLAHVAISDQVKADNVFLTEESWEKVEKNAYLPTETVKQAANTFVDTTLKANGVGDGIASYSRVVELLLWDYYK